MKCLNFRATKATLRDTKFIELQGSTSDSKIRRPPATIPRPEEANQPPSPLYRVKLCEGWKGHDDAPSTRRRAWCFSDYLRIFCILFDVLYPYVLRPLSIARIFGRIFWSFVSHCLISKIFNFATETNFEQLVGRSLRKRYCETGFRSARDFFFGGRDRVTTGKAKTKRTTSAQ